MKFFFFNLAIKYILFCSYTNYIKTDSATQEWGLQLDAPIVVQDPFQLNHNVAKRCSKAHLKELMDYLKQSADILVGSN